ncbi:DUF4185 domain-containing protein [Herbihabitans rhizosphaerae]|uniref:DUF4185 domain-containing protein n=1 Tax=Herbihabitans rhizosphaerae TaxID=1872711 RepID=UPI0030FED3D0
MSTTTELDGGLLFDEVITRRDGMAGQILARDRRRDEVTVIPNSGIFVDGRHFLHYMSVRKWNEPGHWRTNYAGLAVSSNGGRTWSKPRSATWINRAEGDHPFQICAFAHDEAYVYLVGTTNGRFGPAYLARVTPPEILDARAYEYWNGREWSRGNEFDAVPVLPGPVGELSIVYNSHFGQWLALYQDEERAEIVLRTAGELTGRWSEPATVLTGAEYPGLYGSFLHPRSADGPAMYFTMSQWGPYNVFFFKSALT